MHVTTGGIDQGIDEEACDSGIAQVRENVVVHEVACVEADREELFTVAHLCGELFGRLVAKDERPDAVFVASDHMAFAAIDVLRLELRLRVPQDVSVVGFDNVPQAAWGAYGLTTVAQNAVTMIEATVRTLLQQLENDAVTRDHFVVPAELVVHVTLSAAALLRRGVLAWQLPAFASYDELAQPQLACDVLVRAEDPLRPAVRWP